jgi:hypothetical protein
MLFGAAEPWRSRYNSIEHSLPKSLTSALYLIRMVDNGKKKMQEKRKKVIDLEAVGRTSERFRSAGKA